MEGSCRDEREVETAGEEREMDRERTESKNELRDIYMEKEERRERRRQGKDRGIKKKGKV